MDILLKLPTEIQDIVLINISRYWNALEVIKFMSSPIDKWKIKKLHTRMYRLMRNYVNNKNISLHNRNIMIRQLINIHNLYLYTYITLVKDTFHINIYNNYNVDYFKESNDKLRFLSIKIKDMGITPEKHILPTPFFNPFNKVFKKKSILEKTCCRYETRYICMCGSHICSQSSNEIKILSNVQYISLGQYITLTLCKYNTNNIYKSCDLVTHKHGYIGALIDMLTYIYNNI